MNRDDLRNFCLAQKGATEDFPFGPDTAVYRVMGKMFALTPFPNHEPPQINLKCDPAEAELLRKQYPAVQPGYHMSKKHWNTIHVDGTLADELVFQMVEDSYVLVVKSLPKKDRAALAKS
jgi:predicted DNA-binding protein (MmcQ/YjbR family)